jgi:hypothetical protein
MPSSYACFPLFKLLLDKVLLNPQSAGRNRNILWMEIPMCPPQAYSEPNESPLEKSPLDHLLVGRGCTRPGRRFRSGLVVGGEPLGVSAYFGTPFAIASKGGYLNIVWLMPRDYPAGGALLKTPRDSCGQTTRYRCH